MTGKIVFRMTYIVFVAVIAAAYLVFLPGWGFMDDYQCLHAARAFWNGDLSFASLIQNDIQGYGRFRPLYYLWIISAYLISPAVWLYLLILALGMGALFVWGGIIDRLFAKYPFKDFHLFLYPLTFFLFLPFWNIFMYISVQEKFVFLFGALSFSFLIRSYESSQWRWLWASLGCAVLATMGKETGVSLLIAYAAFAFLDLCVFKKDVRRSAVVLIVGIILAGGYLLFMKGVLGGYTARYRSNLDVKALVNCLITAPVMIKGLLALASVTALGVIVLFYQKRLQVHPLFIICPIWVMLYIAILLPWGFPHYLMAPLGPFVMLCLYFIIVRLSDIDQRLFKGVQVALIVCVALVLWGAILPKISKMADKRKVVEELVTLYQAVPQGKFFYPPFYGETAMALEGFSGAKIIYTGTITAADINEGQAAYLLINDEASPVVLKDVRRTGQVYRNGTWAIEKLSLSPGSTESFRLQIEKNIVQRLKDLITAH